MNPKITALDAATTLGTSKEGVSLTLQSRRLPYWKAHHQIYFGHETARKLFQFSFKPRVVVFQIVKGGTGKTSLAYEFAIRASLYGARVLCIDMDQQGNLTQAFNQDAEHLPVMIDILVDHHPLKDSILSVAPGIDLLPSRFENSMLDEVLRLKKLPLEIVYREPLQALKKTYDLIIVDCPPSLGQSVTACALAADFLIAPVTLEKFALSGLEVVYQSLQELKSTFGVNIDFGIVINKFKPRSRNTVNFAFKNSKYEEKLLKTRIGYAQDFPKAIANQESIFDTIRASSAKQDISNLTQELLNIGPKASKLSKGTSTLIRLSRSRTKPKPIIDLIC